jgi:3-deoxy-manno-octulosonate cytidylyltransferase (CMP-KDO synthetase)
MKFVAVIPARYASTRFPGKPLAILGDKPVIQWVYENTREAVDSVWVATDSALIAETVEKFGGKAIITSTEHRSGTDRIAEAARLLPEEFDVIINVQGDEPFIHSSQIESLMSCFENETTDIATLVQAFPANSNFERLFDLNTPKVVLNLQNEAIFFSRSVIPCLRGMEHSRWLSSHTYYKHIGMYAYRSSVLQEITELPPSPLEIAESLEQLRWIENGYRIKVAFTDIETIGIDTPDDLERAKRQFSKFR